MHRRIARAELQRATEFEPSGPRAEAAVRKALEIDPRLTQDLLDRFLAAGAVQVKIGLLGLRAPADKVETAPFHEEHMHVRFPAR